MYDLAESPANQNQFFTQARALASESAARIVINEWYRISEVFCLSIAEFAGTLAAVTRQEAGDDRIRLEQAILVPMAIAAGEFGFGVHGVDGIHYNMFARLGRPLGIAPEDIRSCEPELQETRDLVHTIREAFRDHLGAAACIHVVEGSAFQIVVAFESFFVELEQSGEIILTDHDREYITLHLGIEKEHDAMATAMLDQLIRGQAATLQLRDKTRRIAEDFGRFWDALARRCAKAAKLQHVLSS